MRENYDFSKAVKNPYAKKLKEEGFNILIHYGSKQEDRDIAKEYIPLPEEVQAFEEYRNKKAAE